MSSYTRATPLSSHLTATIWTFQLRGRGGGVLILFQSTEWVVLFRVLGAGPASNGSSCPPCHRRRWPACITPPRSNICLFASLPLWQFANFPFCQFANFPFCHSANLLYWLFFVLCPSAFLIFLLLPFSLSAFFLSAFLSCFAHHQTTARFKLFPFTPSSLSSALFWSLSSLPLPTDSTYAKWLLFTPLRLYPYVTQILDSACVFSHQVLKTRPASPSSPASKQSQHIE